MSYVAQPSRVNYFTGESLNTSDFVAEQDYILQRFQTNVSSLNVWGIAAGLCVSLQSSTLQISPGVAFDYEGRTIVLEEAYSLSLTADQLLAINSSTDPAYLIVSYGLTKSDYTKDSLVGGFKRVVEAPVFTILTYQDEHSLVLASFHSGAMSFDNRRYCSQQLGSLSFASSSTKDGVVPALLPSISGFYNQDAAWGSADHSLRIDSANVLMSGRLKIIQHAEGDDPSQPLLLVEGRTSITSDLEVEGEIMQKGVPVVGTPWKHQPNSQNIYYSDGSVIVGRVPTDACTEKLSVYGEAKITGNIVCNGAGSKFIGDGSGLTNLPNSPWVLGSAATQNNVFYPGLDSQGGAAQGGVGIGSFSSLDIVFPADASLMVNNKAYIEKLSGYPNSSVPVKKGDPVMCSPLVVSSALSIQSEDGSDTNLTIGKGEFIIQSGNQKIAQGNLQVSGNVTAAKYYGDGSQLAGVGYWNIDEATKTVYYAGKVLVGSSTPPSGSDAIFYVNGKAQMDSLAVTGAIVPTAGNKAGCGIQFPDDVGGGSDDTAWIRYYSNGAGGGDPCTLEIGISNDEQDNIFFNPSGNVGIGIANPTTAKLVVAGGIDVVQSDVVNHAVVTPSGSRLLSGYVDAEGKIGTGSGFTVTKLGSGSYKVSFANGYTNRPAVVVSLVSNNTSCSTLANAVVTSIQTGDFTVVCGDEKGLPADSAFSFVAIG